ncbi:hypothetical protein E2C01_019573 [Portunus trituberculatus]|uniref:Uncharacterized protein n=1 Tax=Portunus trituberculatus TaxID=210409 RepID=A0A5B7E0T6_PORTR|nr:hypothetical protein [Portunus trituberculatus]
MSAQPTVLCPFVHGGILVLLPPSPLVLATAAWRSEWNRGGATAALASKETLTSEMITEVMLAVMMVITIMIACLWTNCERRSDLLRGRYTVPGTTFEI